MKVMLLAAANSVHTRRWVEALAARGHAVTLVSQHECGDWRPPADVAFHALPFHGMAGYFLNALPLRRLLARMRPELLNVHYASGYGLTGHLCGFKPTLLSVWGSDVFEFPYEARWKFGLLERTLRGATRIASTSRAMAAQVLRLAPGLAEPFITPFGVDLAAFRPQPERDERFITIGTVKTLAPTYGVDVLIAAFQRLVDDPQMQPLAGRLRLLLVGGGPDRAMLERLAATHGRASQVEFVGQVPHADVPRWLNRLDVYVAPSRRESFGVAVIEASACGVPVIVSDAGGLPEVVEDGLTGLVVPVEDADALARALKTLVLDADLRQRMGAAGLRFVAEHYEWGRAVERMEAAYRGTLESSVR